VHGQPRPRRTAVRGDGSQAAPPGGPCWLRPGPHRKETACSPPLPAPCPTRLTPRLYRW